MANHIEDIAKILGVELGEKFKTIDTVGDESVCDYYFNNTDLIVSGQEYCAEPSILYNLIFGNYSIKRKPWKPSTCSIYHYVGDDSMIHRTAWANTLFDKFLYKLGNCYRTREEAEANRAKWIAFYESDEVLDV